MRPQAVRLGTPQVMTPARRLTIALQRGATVARAAQIAGVSEEYAQLMVDHMTRAGLVRQAGNNSCEHGLCSSSSAAADPNMALHCAGCPLSIRRG
ncbi:hypothetical protein [Trueperella sp. LYQ143]|uniref:hypothetical protein n=1 Tax=Trueperella sp. LYQ143 TaxID=3391059 RepID=UPI003983287F